MSDSPPPEKRPKRRPKITLPVPAAQFFPQAPMGYIATPYGPANVPITPITAQPIIYPNKAREFMFTQFRGIKDFTKSGLSVGEKSAFWLYEKVSSWSKKWFTHIFLFAILILYSVGGGLLFVTVEGAWNEEILRFDIQKDRNETLRLIRELSNDQRLIANSELWNRKAANHLVKYEGQLFEFFKRGFSDSNKQVWSFWNAIVFAATLYTTIGYGHLAPSTTTGRAITIVYALFGIPMFLIILADFGKLFTKAMKFLWAFVRRLYYTGSCRKVRRTAPVQEVMKGVQLVYDFATFRRPSQLNPEEFEEMAKGGNRPQTILNLDGNLPQQQQQQQPDTPGTPAMSAFDIDDEFNLPISVAIFVLIVYIFIGAAAFFMLEDWTFFESFYFVFISMSTVGLGDIILSNPLYMIFSIVYLVFGLALTSMCINVVQVMLSDQFQQASRKIGASIGLRVTEANLEGSLQSVVPPMVQVPEVVEQSSPQKLAPKVKVDEADL